MKSTWLIVCAAALPAAAPIAVAHHSNRMFDFSREVSLEGTVLEYEWTNPHVQLQLLAVDGEVWSVEFSSIHVMQGMCWSEHTVKAGERIVVFGRPSSRQMLLATAVRKQDGRLLRLYWQNEEPSSPCENFSFSR